MDLDPIGRHLHGFRFISVDLDGFGMYLDAFGMDLNGLGWIRVDLWCVWVDLDGIPLILEEFNGFCWICIDISCFLENLIVLENYWNKMIYPG